MGCDASDLKLYRRVQRYFQAGYNLHSRRTFIREEPPCICSFKGSSARLIAQSSSVSKTITRSQNAAKLVLVGQVQPTTVNAAPAEPI